MIGWFNKRLNVPVEQRNYGLIYASLSLLLFIGTFWAVYHEIDSRRPWKDYQEQYRSLKVRVLKYQMKQLKAKVDKGELKKLNSEIRAIENQLQSGKAAEAKRQVDELSIQLRDVGQERANLKSVADNRNYLFEHNRKEGHIG